MRSLHSTTLRSAFVACGVLAGTLISGAASAAASLADLGLSEAQAEALLKRLNAPKSSPGIAFGSPVGFGLSWGQIGVGVGGATNDNPNVDDYDGSAAVSIGLGDANKWVGLEANVNIISLNDNGPNSAFGEDGSVNLKLHTTLPGQAAFAVGVQNIGRWGAAADDPDSSSSVYAAVTKIYNLSSNPLSPLPLSVNIGVGDGRFQNNGNDGASVFGGIAIIPHQKFSIITDWTGQDLNAGVSIAPFHNYALTITLGAVNLVERLDRPTEFAGGIGYSFKF